MAREIAFAVAPRTLTTPPTPLHDAPHGGFLVTGVKEMRMQQIIGARSWIIDPIEEWSQLWTDCNWYNITPISVEFEWDKIFGAVEATVILLGVGLRLRWTYAETKEARRVKTIADRLRPSA